MINRLKELNEKATEGPWEYTYVEPYEAELVGPKGIKVCLDDAPVHDYNAQVDSDAELITLSRNMLPDLLLLYSAVKNKSYADMKDICQRLEKGAGGEGE